METLVIDQEFRDLCPPLRESERAALEASIIKDGCLQSLIVWDKTIIDGHNRYDICTSLGIEFGIEQISFDNRTQAKWWIISHQLARRNVTMVQASYLRGRYWDLCKVSAHGVNKKAGEKVLPNGFKSRQEFIGHALGVSASTIRNDYDVFKAIESFCDEAKSYVLSGRERIRKQHVVDMSALGHEAQRKLLSRINEGKIKSISSALRGFRGSGAHSGNAKTAPIIKCPTCGIRLARGVTTCLKCDLGDKVISDALDECCKETAQEDGDFPIPSDVEERLARVREAKMAEEGGSLNDAIEFHAGRLHRLLNAEEQPALEIGAATTLRKLVKRIAQIVDLSKAKVQLHGESSYAIRKRSGVA